MNWPKAYLRKIPVLSLPRKDPPDTCLQAMGHQSLYLKRATWNLQLRSFPVIRTSSFYFEV